MQRFIRLAQYSSVHHFINLRRISRPTAPPSASASEGRGEGNRDVVEERVRSERAVSFTSSRILSLAALDKLSRLPVPNLLQTWSGLLRCLLTWKIRQTSDCRFFLFSESTALSSREVQEGAKSGEWKKEENLSRAPVKADVVTLK